MLITRLWEAIHFYSMCGQLSHVNIGKCATNFCTVEYFKYSGNQAPVLWGKNRSLSPCLGAIQMNTVGVQLSLRVLQHCRAV